MDLTGLSVNTADAIAVAVIVITGVFALWGVKKAIAMGNKG